MKLESSSLVGVCSAKGKQGCGNKILGKARYRRNLKVWVQCFICKGASKLKEALTLLAPQEITYETLFLMKLKIKRHTMPGVIVITVAAILGFGSSNLSGSTATSNLTRAAKPKAVRYTINAAQSEFIVRANRGGLLGFAGHDHNIAIRGFTGEATLTRDNIEPASLQMRIMADSLFVIDNVKEEDRLQIEHDMREKVLETEKYPEIVFKSAKVTVSKRDDDKYEITIWGDLTLHGATRSVRIEVQMTLHDTTLRAQGEFSVEQKDYGIKPFSVAAGTVKVKDELKLSFDIVADQQSVD